MSAPKDTEVVGAPTPIPISPPAKAPKKGSGEHPAMADAIRKLDAADADLLELEAATQRLGRAVLASEKPAAKTIPAPPLSHPNIGLWVLGLRGRGQHHNSDRRDVERLASKFVEELRRAGHDVEIAQATFDAGAPEDVSSAPVRPKKG